MPTRLGTEYTVEPNAMSDDSTDRLLAAIQGLIHTEINSALATHQAKLEAALDEQRGGP